MSSLPLRSQSGCEKCATVSASLGKGNELLKEAVPRPLYIFYHFPLFSLSGDFRLTGRAPLCGQPLDPTDWFAQSNFKTKAKILEKPEGEVSLGKFLTEIYNLCKKYSQFFEEFNRISSADRGLRAHANSALEPSIFKQAVWICDPRKFTLPNFRNRQDLHNSKTHSW